MDRVLNFLSFPASDWPFLDLFPNCSYINLSLTSPKHLHPEGAGSRFLQSVGNLHQNHTECYNLKITAIIGWKLLTSLLQMPLVYHEEILK
jgi:hypothetical protein